MSIVESLKFIFAIVIACPICAMEGYMLWLIWTMITVFIPPLRNMSERAHKIQMWCFIVITTIVATLFISVSMVQATYNRGYSDAEEYHEHDYQTGYDDGYQEGYQDGRNAIDLDVPYNYGYDDGYDAGYEDALTDQ